MLNTGDVIKVNDNVPTFGGCLMYVDRVYYWGVQAGIKLPGEDRGGREDYKETFIRLLNEDFTVIGGSKKMGIEEIKKALREVKRICKETSNCKFCPLSIDGGCPITDVYGDKVDYPEEWVLDWNDDKKE